MAKIEITVGDSKKIERELMNLPSDDYLTKAWFTVKEKYTDADVAAKIQKSITTILQPSGVISDTGQTPSTSAYVQFLLSTADTLNLTAGKRYYYDIQIKTALSSVQTVESGEITPDPQVTISDT